MKVLLIIILALSIVCFICMFVMYIQGKKIENLKKINKANEESVNKLKEYIKEIGAINDNHSKLQEKIKDNPSDVISDIIKHNNSKL